MWRGLVPWGYATVKVLPTELPGIQQYCRGKTSIDYPAQANPYNILLSSERRDFADVTVPHTAVRRPTLFVSIPGEPGRHRVRGVRVGCGEWRVCHHQVSSLTAHARVSVRKTFQVSVLDEVKCEGVTVPAEL